MKHNTKQTRIDEHVLPDIAKQQIVDGKIVVEKTEQSTLSRKRFFASSRLGSISILVMMALLLTKVTGQFRQILIGMRFGYDTNFADAFTQGFLIPDFVYTLLIGGSIQSTIIPYLSGKLEKFESEAGWKAVSTFITFMSLVMLAVLLLCEIFAPIIMVNFTTETSYPMAVVAARALLPQAFFMMLAALLIGILNTYKKFISTALTPCVYNIFVLLSLFYFAKQSEAGVMYASLGISLGALGYFLIQLFLARREIKNFRPSLDLRNPEVKQLFRLAIPTLISASIPYMSTFLISSYFRLFQDGTSYAYSNAVSTWQLPFGIVVIAITNVTLPHLSEMFARNDHSGAGRLLSQGLRSALFIMIPAAGCFFVMSKDVIEGIFRWGNSMSAESISYTASILQVYCIVMITNTITYFLNNIFFANRKTWVPMTSSAINLLFLFLFSRLLVDYLYFGPTSMALAFALASLISTIFLLIMMNLFFTQVKIIGFGKFLLVAIMGLSVSAGALYLWQMLTLDWQPLGKIWQLLYILVRAIVVYAIFMAVLWINKNEEINFIIQKLKNK